MIFVKRKDLNLGEDSFLLLHVRNILYISYVLKNLLRSFSANLPITIFVSSTEIVKKNPDNFISRL